MTTEPTNTEASSSSENRTESSFLTKMPHRDRAVETVRVLRDTFEDLLDPTSGTGSIGRSLGMSLLVTHAASLAIFEYIDSLEKKVSSQRTKIESLERAIAEINGKLNNIVSMTTRIG